MVRSFASSPLPAYERGVELGRAHAADVARTTRRYADLFARRGEPGFDAHAWAARFREVVGDTEPDALAEIRGIAAGAGLDELDVMAVDARTEILAKADPYGQRECSAVLVAPPEGPAFGVQTWDWYAEMADGWFRWRIPRPDGSWIETVTEYGLLGKIGVSSRGVGVLLTILHHEADAGDDVGYPVHLLARRILERCASADEAVELCCSTPVAASTSLTVMDPAGGATVELFPGGPGVLRPSEGLLVRTNHFVTTAGAPGCLVGEDYPTTFIRRDHLDTTLRARPPRAPADVVSAMTHHHPDGGVCRHGSEAGETATLATVSITTEPPGLDVLAGGPCQGVVQTYPRA
ncbi:hypothetical protein D9V37_18150 [Nocardioides mangrovicus]|uniref:Peptidase C45 hydrolase domain-containing protein n=1 Tax=Nocardioides mangrovicus TaxID=2478913 RepID=A0A3L8NZ18_9ACTN|nr:C45 family peptidase [Nocardioides mangrovicus]RLV48021.1 hypothetical protein D9V37_18150 [Nocardioides mangrovicus]